jgi:hypothetical protein
MIPTVPELLIGNFTSLLDPPPPEAMGEFLAGKLAVIAMISFLLAEEAERGAAMRVAENRAIRTLFAEAAHSAWTPDLSGRLEELARGEDSDLVLTALDRTNAELRTALIALHAAVEESIGPAARQREQRILRLLREAAAARLLELPPMPA